MIFLLPYYLQNSEYFETIITPNKADDISSGIISGETPVKTPNKTQSETPVNNNISSYVLLYFVFSLTMFFVSLYLNWQDNQPTSVCFICAIHAFGNSIFYFIFIIIYYLRYYSKHNYYYVKFSKEFNTKDIKSIHDIKTVETFINDLLLKQK